MILRKIIIQNKYCRKHYYARYCTNNNLLLLLLLHYWCETFNKTVFCKRNLSLLIDISLITLSIYKFKLEILFKKLKFNYT